MLSSNIETYRINIPQTDCSKANEKETTNGIFMDKAALTIDKDLDIDLGTKINTTLLAVSCLER